MLERIVEHIRAEGPLRFDEYLELALYDPDDGFYATTGGAGRSRDFLTSVEVGPLFSAVLARAIDTWWEESGRPVPWTVVDAGAGSSALLPAVLTCEPDCAGAMRPVAVDRSAAQRNRHPAAVESLSALPEGPIDGVIVANELLDNLPWRLLENTAHGWSEVSVEVNPDGDLSEVLMSADDAIRRRAAELAPEARIGARVPIHDRAAAWLADALACVRRGRVIVLDYGSTTADLAGRPSSEWLRTYRGHEQGGDALDEPGSQDITIDVATDQLAAVRMPAEHRAQGQFLRAHGLDELVAEGRRAWSERAHLGDLEAVRARSRIGEGLALTDPTGLGAFRVLEWQL